MTGNGGFHIRDVILHKIFNPTKQKNLNNWDNQTWRKI